VTVATEPTVDEIQTAIKQRLEAAGIRAYATEPDKPNFPCVYPRVVDWTFDETLGHASTTWHFDLWVLVGLEPGFNRAQTWLNPYLSPTGSSSIKAAIDSDATLGIGVQARVSGGGAYGRVDIAGITALGASVRLEVLT
jgi:hypothetical protein